jgi:hypothetical protein
VELWTLRTEAWSHSWISIRFVNKTNSLVAEPEGSTAIITRPMLNQFHLAPSATTSFPETSFIVFLLFPSLYFKYVLSSPPEMYLQKFYKISLFPHGQSFLCDLQFSAVRIRWSVQTRTYTLYNMYTEFININFLCIKYFIRYTMELLYCLGLLYLETMFAT